MIVCPFLSGVAVGYALIWVGRKTAKWATTEPKHRTKARTFPRVLP